jgi:hypothetical protein
MLMNMLSLGDQERKNRSNENGYKCDDRSQRQGGLTQEFLMTTCGHKNFGRASPIRSSQKRLHDPVPQALEMKREHTNAIDRY